MTEKNKYFVPQIEDIRVGYEFEIKDKDGNWKPNGLVMNQYSSNPNDYNVLAVVQNEIRVPYLTKEQIEGNGWELLLPEGHYFKDRRRLSFDVERNRIMIYDMFDNVFYSGKCPSINELRYICKLLNIN